MIGYVYSIGNILTGDIYIGSTKNFIHRKRQHLSKLKKNKHHSKQLQENYNNLGENVLFFQVIEQVDNINDEIAIKNREQFWLDFFKPKYNTSINAFSPIKGRKHSEDTLKRLSEIRTGKKKKPCSEISKLKFRESAKPLFKPVYKCNLNGDILEMFDCISDASKSLFTSKQNILRAIKNNGIAKGFKWIFA